MRILQASSWSFFCVVGRGAEDQHIVLRSGGNVLHQSRLERAGARRESRIRAAMDAAAGRPLRSVSSGLSERIVPAPTRSASF